MARHSKMNSVSSMASSGLESIRDGTASTVSLAMTGVSSNVTSEGGSGGLNDAFRASRDWKLREASISNLESQQRRLQQELALLGPKQQQARSKERLKGRSPALGPDGLPRSGWEVRPMEERYRLLKKLKGGAMAIVYLAEDRSTTAFYHEVVLKVLSAGATFEQRQRMIREVSLVGAVRHPNVVKYQDAAEAPDGALFIAMDVIHGRDLQQVIDKNKRLHPVYVVEVVSGVLKGLKALHEKLIVHRDLKPANVIVSPETGHVKIIDLGLAKHLETESMLTGDNVVGTPMYFAPEQTRSGTAVSTNLDLWAVGVMIFHCTTGTLPFARLGDSLEVIVHEIRTKEARRLAETYSSVCQAPPPSQLPYLQAVVDKALVKDATKRVQTASEMLSLLASVPMQSTPAVQTPLSSPAEAGKGWGREERDDGARQAVAAAEAAAAAAAEEADRARITLTKTRQDLATAEGNRAEQQSEINELNKQVADLRLALEAKESESKERIDVEAARDRQADGVTRNTAALSEAIQQEVTGTGQQLEESNIKLTRKVRMFESRAIEAEKEIQELRQQLQREREQQTSQAGQGGSVNPDNNSDLDRVYEELADKEIETEDLKEQLKNLRATAQQQLADAANELSSMRSRLTKEQARVSQLQVSMKESSLHDTSAAARGSHSWKADSSDGPGQVYEMQADNTLALVPVASKKKGGRHGDGGEAGGGLEVVVSSKKPSRDSAAAKSLHANEEDGEEDAVDLDLDRQLDRLQYQKFSRDREIDRLRGEVSSVRGLMTAKEKEMNTLTREMELKDAELRSMRTVKRTKSGVFSSIHSHFLLNGDTNGVLYKLGVAGGLKTWENPARNGLCRVICGLQGVTATNGVREVAAHKEDVLERAVVADTFAFDDGWFILDLDPADLGVTLRPSYYTIRNGGGKGRCLTGWVLEGSDGLDENAKWKKLDSHEEDQSFVLLASETTRDVYPHHSLSWMIQTTRSFRAFRLRLKSNNWGNKQMFVQGFELYGMLKLPSTHPAVTGTY